MRDTLYKHYVTLLLLTIYLFNQADRAIFSFLMEPIKRELLLSDSQLGFLAGPALVLFYAGLGIPVARWADRSNRVNVMSFAIVMWSGIVMLTALAGKFWQIALTRFGVGIGEAGFSPIAQSLIADNNSEPERTRALSIFMLAIPLGSVLSSLAGGWVSQAYGWRAAFIAVGFPGIILAVLLKLTVKAPSPTHKNGGGRPPFAPAAVFSDIWQRRSLRHLACALGTGNIAVACLITWMPAFFERNHAISGGVLGSWLAVIFGVGGSAGILLGGRLSSWLGQKGERPKIVLMAFSTALIAPTATMLLWCPSLGVSLVLLLPLQVLMYFSFAPTYSLVQSLSAPDTRATMASVFVFIQVLSGGVMGVQLVGLLSDAITPLLGNSGASLRWSMTVTSLFALWGAVHFWLCSRSVLLDLATGPIVLARA